MQSYLHWTQLLVSFVAEKAFTHHVPRPWDPNVAPCTADFALRVKSPYWFQARSSFGSDDASHRIPGVTISERRCQGQAS